ERVVAAVLAGQSSRAVAARFGIAVSSVVKWSQRHRATGSVAPGKMGGHRKRVLEPHRAFILEQIAQTPHLTLHRLRDVLAARGVGVSAGDLGRLASTRGDWSSSTKPGSRPTWRRYADGGSKASACAASPRTATGAR